MELRSKCYLVDQVEELVQTALLTLPIVLVSTVMRRHGDHLPHRKETGRRHRSYRHSTRGLTKQNTISTFYVCMMKREPNRSRESDIHLAPGRSHLLIHLSAILDRYPKCQLKSLSEAQNSHTQSSYTAADTHNFVRCDRQGMTERYFAMDRR